MLYFLYLGLFILFTVCKSENSLYARHVQSTEDLPSILVRRYLESNNLLYARDLYDQTSRSNTPHDKLFRRELEDQILLRRTIPPWEVQQMISKYNAMTKGFRSHYEMYEGKFSGLDPTKSHAARSEVAMVEKVVTAMEQKWRADRHELKDLVYKNARELTSDGRVRESQNLKTALDEAYVEGERVQELMGIFTKQNEEYKRTGNWPKWPGTSGSTVGESSTQSTKDEEGTSAGSSKSQGGSKSGKGRGQGSGKGKRSRLRKGFL